VAQVTIYLQYSSVQNAFYINLFYTEKYFHCTTYFLLFVRQNNKYIAQNAET